jgi:hypothetical protein
MFRIPRAGTLSANAMPKALQCSMQARDCDLVRGSKEETPDPGTDD